MHYELQRLDGYTLKHVVQSGQAGRARGGEQAEIGNEKYCTDGKHTQERKIRINLKIGKTLNNKNKIEPSRSRGGQPKMGQSDLV